MPDHCIENTLGAEFCEGLDRTRIDEVIRKGTDRNADSYSGFFDNGRRKATGLAELLHANGVDEVHVMGLATDYCVKFTAMDAVALGFETKLIVKGSRGVDREPGDSTRAIQAMCDAGIVMLEPEATA